MSLLKLTISAKNSKLCPRISWGIFLQGFRVDHLLKASLNYNLLLFLLLQEGHVDELDTKKAIAVFQNLTVCI